MLIELLQSAMLSSMTYYVSRVTAIMTSLRMGCGVFSLQIGGGILVV